MRARKQRARTGCLTCRARRVKCDEQKPNCRRCITANVACAGYEEQRVVVPINSGSFTSGRRQRRDALPSVSQVLSPRHNLPSTSEDQTTRQSLRSPGTSTTASGSTGMNSFNGSSNDMRETAQSSDAVAQGYQTQALVAFPSVPRPGQSPSLGAKHILGFHQSLLRTIPILFASGSLHFWRDELFQEAWGCDYLYLTLVALGNVHRAALLTVSEDVDDQVNSLSTKITAVQIYIEALEALSKSLEEAGNRPVLLVAVLALMAYFESFSGNIPAFAGRIQAAEHYLKTSQFQPETSLDQSHKSSGLDQVLNCLWLLRQTYYVTLPLNLVHATTDDSDCTMYSSIRERSGKAMPMATTSEAALRKLVDLVSTDAEMNELVWSPLAPYARQTTAQTLLDFEQRLIEWKNIYLELVPELDSDSALQALLVYKWSTFAMPPSPYTSTTRLKSLIAAHYNFYRACVNWALLLLGHDEERTKPTADFFFYEALRHAASHLAFLKAADGDPDKYIPCESLRVGLLPVLHITGLCSAQPSWLEWIRDSSRQIIQEGILKGHTFATNLQCLHEFESRRWKAKADSSSNLERYPEPCQRIICQLIPETDGRHFTSVFAMPSEHNDPRHVGLSGYRAIGEARWVCGYGEAPCTPVYNVYDEEDPGMVPFSMEWLYRTQPLRSWLAWSRDRAFNIERALQDHINGTRLLLAADQSTLT